GIVVPSSVELSQLFVPVLVNTSVAATVWPHAIVIAGCEASGQLWLTNDAPHGIAPYAASTDFAYARRWVSTQSPQISYLSMNAVVASVTLVAAFRSENP